MEDLQHFSHGCMDAGLCSHLVNGKVCRGGEVGQDPVGKIATNYGFRLGSTFSVMDS